MSLGLPLTEHDYGAAVSRNLGFVSAHEQHVLRRATVAIAGVGGDGGLLAVQLARMGVGAFRLADPEAFETENLNRQAGCSISTIGMNKAEAISQMIVGINPAAELTVFTEGVTEANVDSFLTGADLLVDETEITTPHIAVLLARAARAAGIPNMTVLNIGFSCLATSFLPAGRTLERVLRLPETGPVHDADVPLDRWLPYLPPYVDLDVLRGVVAGELAVPSIAPGVGVAAAVGASQAFLHLVHAAEPDSVRPRPISAPNALVVDVLTGQAKRLAMTRRNHYRHVARLALRSALRRTPRVTTPLPAT